MDFSPTELAKIAIWYDHSKSVRDVQRSFRTEFGDPHRVPGRELIVGCHARLLATGSVLPGRPGPKRGAPARPKRTLSTEARVVGSLSAQSGEVAQAGREGASAKCRNSPSCSSQRDANYTIKFVQHRKILHQRPHEKIRIITAVIKIQSSGGNSETPCTSSYLYETCFEQP